MKELMFKILTLLLALAVSGGGLSAQKNKTTSPERDSLLGVFDGYIGKYESNLGLRPYDAVAYADSARRFAERNILDSISTALSYRCCGRAKYVARNYQQALQYQLRAYKIYVKLERQDDVATALVDIARIYYAQELYDLAQEYCLNAIEICNENDFAETKADAYCVLGRMAVNLGSGYSEAVFNMKYARAVYDSLNLSDKLFDINSFLARAYFQGNAYDSAMKYLNMNFDDYQHAGQKSKIAITYNTCGDIYRGAGDFSEALKYYRNALSMFEECGMVYNVLSVKYSIVKMDFDNGSYAAAAEGASKLVHELEKYEYAYRNHEYNLKHQVYNILYSSYIRLGNTDSALKYCEFYAKVADSIFIVRNKERVVDFFISMEGYKHHDELLMEGFKKERQKFYEAKRDYKIIYLILLGVIGLLMAVFAVFIHWYRGVLGENKSLGKSNSLLEKEIQERKATEAELKSSEEKYRFIFRKLPVGIIQFNEKLVVTSVNDACMQILGVKNRSLIGINATTVLPPKLFDELRILNENSKDEDNIIKHELDIKTSDSEISVEAVLKSYYYNSGLDVGRAGIIMIQDITERKAEEKDEEGRFATVRNTFEMLPDTIFRLDEKANYIFAKIPGLPADKQQAYLGQNMRTMTDGSLLIKFLVAFNNVRKTGETQYVEYQTVTPPEKYKEARFSLCVDNTVLLAIRDVEPDKITTHDGGAKKDGEPCLAETEFLNGMSAELKEPLETILRNCEALSAKNGDQESALMLKEVLNAASYANETLSDVLKLSPASGKGQGGYVNPVELATDVFKIFEQRAAEKNLAYNFYSENGVPQALDIDAARIRQILFNLLSNAVKYTEEGKVSLALSARRTAPETVTLVFEVKDTGRGLSGSQQEELFKGTGISRGLVLSKKMADSMKASIEVKSAEGDGSVFVLTIPELYAPVLNNSAATNDSVLSSAKKMRNQDGLKEYISVVKYAVIPEFKALKSDISFKELYDFAGRFREQSVNSNMEKGVELADKLLSDIKNYDISNIMVDSRKIEKYIYDLVK